LSSILPSVFPEQLNEVRYYLFALPFIIGLWIVISFAFGLYRRQKGLTHFEELVCIFKTAFLFLISALAVAFLFKEWDLGRSVVFLATLLGLILLGVSRLVYHTLEKWGLHSGLGGFRRSSSAPVL
jgi:FlaA1/EpsC-like NDP-sugar epimerase